MIGDGSRWRSCNIKWEKCLRLKTYSGDSGGEGKDIFMEGGRGGSETCPAGAGEKTPVIKSTSLLADALLGLPVSVRAILIPYRNQITCDRVLVALHVIQVFLASQVPAALAPRTDPRHGCAGALADDRVTPAAL